MSSHFYHLCCRGIGRPVTIRTKDGRIHRGIITHVDRHQAYLRPIRPRRNLGGFGYGFYRPRYGYYRPWYGGYNWAAFGWGIALGAIASLAFW